MKRLKEKFLLPIALCAIQTVFAQQPVKVVKPFSDVVASNGLVFVSGQLGINTLTKDKHSFSDEVRGAIKNVDMILKKNGLSLENAVSVTVYLKEAAQFSVFNQVYLSYFTPPFPARTCVIVKDLVQHANIEISVIASSKEAFRF
jgi:2-iminobutanoate/2-iminopropanoate deaminase